MSAGHLHGLRVLLGLLPEASAYHASWHLASLLRNNGCVVSYVGHRSFAELVAGHGFDFESLDYRDFIGEQRENLRRMSRVRGLVTAARLATATYRHLLESLDRILETREVDLFLMDQMAWMFSPPVCRRRIPLIGINVNLASTPSWDRPSLFSRSPAGGRPCLATRARNAVSWLRALAGQLALDQPMGLLRWLGWGRFDGYCSAIARELVLEAGGRLRRCEYFYQLDVPELVLFPREFDLPSNCMDPRRCYIGLGIGGARTEAPFPFERLDPSKKLVYCSLGSYAAVNPNRRRIFESAVWALERLPDWQMVLHAGGVDWGGDATLPGNVLVVKAAPQLRLLERAAVAVNHGGPSSIREAIHHGVPMLSFPCAHDQHGLAARVAFHKLGIRGDPRRITGERMLAHLRELAGDERYRNAVRAMRRSPGCQDCDRTTLEFVAHCLHRG